MTDVCELNGECPWKEAYCVGVGGRGREAGRESRPGGICVEPQMCAAWTSALSAAIVKETFKMVDISILQSPLFRPGPLSRGQSQELMTLLCYFGTCAHPFHSGAGLVPHPKIIQIGCPVRKFINHVDSTTNNSNL